MPEKPDPLSFKQTLKMRRNYLGKSCKLHYEGSPIKIVKSSRQYIYDDNGNEYLDCINNVSHVGHCHPHVVGAGQEQMAKLSTSFGFLSDIQVEYAKRLVELLPENLCVCYFLNSGSEANDLALRLARAYTRNTDVICIDNSYHGNTENVIQVSPSRLKRHNMPKEDWVHIVPAPDIYRGKYREDTLNPGLLYANEVKHAIRSAMDKGRSVAGFIHEPLCVNSGVISPPPGFTKSVYSIFKRTIDDHIKWDYYFSKTFFGNGVQIAGYISETMMTLCGMVIPPKDYFRTAYRYVREAGGVCIADEVQTGLGRCGDKYWGFQYHDVVPDIVTMGKPLGNGFPLAVVVTTKEISDSLKEFSSAFGGNPVACAMGMAVLDVIKNEQLVSSAKNVGKCLIDGLRAIQGNHDFIGDIRGMGMVVGLEMVIDKESRKPNKDAAELLVYKMKEKKIMINNDGPDKNVLIFLPPMCFTCDNARTLVQAIDQTLAEIKQEASQVDLSSGLGMPIEVPLSILTGTKHRLSSDEEEEDFDSQNKRMRCSYEEMD